MNLSDLKKGQQLGFKKIIIRMSDLQNLLEKISEINYFSIFQLSYWINYKFFVPVAIVVDYMNKFLLLFIAFLF
jgi:hypothetical protein